MTDYVGQAFVVEPDGDEVGGYRISDPYTNGIVAGERFDFDLDDVEEWLNDD